MMSSTPYHSAIAKIDLAAHTTIQNALGQISYHRNPGQVQKNIESETALSCDDFVSLLNALLAELQQGKSPAESWTTACRAHQFKGCALSGKNIPTTLGRVKGLEGHAVSIAKANVGGITERAARKALDKYSGQSDIGVFEPMLRATSLGDYLIWATFDTNDSKRNPFDSLPRSHADVCTALGLGEMHLSGEPLIILVWDHIKSGTPMLHRPTVADANDYSFFRPHADPANPWGMTEPLTPNSKSIPAQPEVVMRKTLSTGLELPFFVLYV